MTDLPPELRHADDRPPRRPAWTRWAVTAIALLLVLGLVLSMSSGVIALFR